MHGKQRRPRKAGHVLAKAKIRLRDRLVGVLAHRARAAALACLHLRGNFLEAPASARTVNCAVTAPQRIARAETRQCLLSHRRA